MTRDEATEAIRRATDIFAEVVTATRPDGGDGYTVAFRIAKPDALDAMQTIGGNAQVVNIQVSEGGAKVVIGSAGADMTLAELTRASEFSHNDNNNGNF